MVWCPQQKDSFSGAPASHSGPPASQHLSARRRKELGLLPTSALLPQGQEPAWWVREGWPVPGAARGSHWLWGLKTVIPLLKVSRPVVIRGEIVLPKNLSEF